MLGLLWTSRAAPKGPSGVGGESGCSRSSRADAMRLPSGWRTMSLTQENWVQTVFHRVGTRTWTAVRKRSCLGLPTGLGQERERGRGRASQTPQRGRREPARNTSPCRQASGGLSRKGEGVPQQSRLLKLFAREAPPLPLGLLFSLNPQHASPTYHKEHRTQKALLGSPNGEKWVVWTGPCERSYGMGAPL